MQHRRPYTKRRRAESEAETRDRIVAATVALHEEVGPARTTVAAIAERAGVHRPTVYRHFPETSDLLAACSGLWERMHPPPDPGSWIAVRSPEARLRVALDELYAYYEETGAMIRNVLADGAVVPEVAVYAAQFEEYFSMIGDVLMADRRDVGRLTHAAVAVAVAFETWATATRRAELTRAEAVDLAVGLVAATAPPRRHA